MSKFDEKGDVTRPEELEISSGAAAHIKLENISGERTEGEWAQLLEDAIAAEAAERALGWKRAFRDYPKSIFWSFAISLCIVM